MTEDVEYHEARKARERAIASSLPEGAARERHLELADRHADRAWLVRNGHPDDLIDRLARKVTRRRTIDLGVSHAIRRSHDLLARSHRILAESRREMPSDG